MDNKVLDDSPKDLPNGTAVLVLGICSIVLCFCYGFFGIVCGIIALILAKADNKLYQENPNAYTQSSFSNLKAGRICGIIGLSLSSLYFIIILIYIVLIIMGTVGAGVFESFMTI